MSHIERPTAASALPLPIPALRADPERRVRFVGTEIEGTVITPNLTIDPVNNELTEDALSFLVQWDHYPIPGVVAVTQFERIA